MARPCTLVQLDSVEAFASDWAYGEYDRKGLGKRWGVDISTIDNWKRRDDVKQYAKKILDDRALKVKRKADALINEFLTTAHPVDDIKEILAVRKAFQNEGPADVEKSSADLIAEAMEAMEANPEVAEGLHQKLKDG